MLLCLSVVLLLLPCLSASLERLFIHVCEALPMIVGAWSMAVMLWYSHEYY